jgi:hypothetical protein
VKCCEYDHVSIKNLESSAKVLSGLASHQSYIKEGHLTDIQDGPYLRGVYTRDKVKSLSTAAWNDAKIFIEIV